MSELKLGNDVFRDGLADRNLWSNQAQAKDIGLNWHLNPCTKIDLDWQHASFGAPVYNGTGSFTRTSDLIWLRDQFF